ncbi:MAG: glycosyltransferase [Alphaproteobacteria bacterium]|nr:glycosyltransferase [Alphaproteobacteria bacterium]
MTGVVTLLSCLSLVAWIYLALFHGAFWRPLLDDLVLEPSNWPSIDIIVPARNEASVLPASLPSLLAQDYPGLWRILLVDDHSQDGTGDVARRLASTNNLSDRLTVLSAPDLPPGWSGKVATQHAGVSQSNADYILFTDADIAHPKDSLRRLMARAVISKLDLVSLMVKLRCESRAENLLIPAFVFFFAMLYPFRRANNPASNVAAAAGGVMLVRRQALRNAGGLERIKAALIDDCSLARIIKDSGGEHGTPSAIRLTLTEDVKSLRPYPSLADIWRMVARTAFTQLHYSPLLLLGTVLGMGLLFLLPVVGILTGFPLVAETSLAALLTLWTLYLPVVRFYKLPFLWAFTLPAAALIYIAATIDSARQYWQGRGGQWKGRAQASS